MTRCMDLVDQLSDQLPANIVEALVEANRQRQETNEQLGREAQLLLDIEKERAKRRLATKSQPVDNCPQATGKARDHAGQQLGQSGRHPLTDVYHQPC